MLVIQTPAIKANRDYSLEQEFKIKEKQLNYLLDIQDPTIIEALSDLGPE